MSADPFDKYQSSEYFAGDQSEEQSLRNVEIRLRKITMEKPTGRLWKWVAVAAAALLLLFASKISMTNASDCAALASRFYKPFPNYQQLTNRGQAAIESRQEAYTRYDRGEYDTSVHAFERIPDRSGPDDLYYAIALQAIGQWQQSAGILKVIKAKLPAEYHAAANWHYALSLVATDRQEEAKSLLEELGSGQSSFAKQSMRLLKAIE